jgi:hypothetical protein
MVGAWRNVGGSHNTHALSLINLESDEAKVTKT